MNTNTFTYRVAFNLYASARQNIIPKPGTITLDESGVLTLTDTSNQEIIVQKPFAELAGVRPVQLMHLNKYASGVYSLILYVGHNEAYKIIFGSNDPVLNSGINTYEKLLSGDKLGAIEEFKANNITQADKGAITSAIHQANNDYENFIYKAKQAGVYKSPLSSAPFFGGVLIFIVVIVLMIFVLLK